VLEPSVVLQADRDAGRPPGVTSDWGEKTRRACPFSNRGPGVVPIKRSSGHRRSASLRSGTAIGRSGGRRRQCTRPISARAGNALAFRRNDLTENMQEACARRVEVLMTTAASAAIVIRIRAVGVYKFSLNFSKFS